MSDAAETRDALSERLSSDDDVLVVVAGPNGAGPNGAGKTTFVETFLKTAGLRIVNPDQIARALSPDDPDAVAYEAARLADTVRRDLVSRRVSFCMETVFSDDVWTPTAEAPLERGGLISVQVLNELGSVAHRMLRMSWPEITEALGTIRILCPSPLSVTAEMHNAALRLTGQHGVHICDALIEWRHPKRTAPRSTRKTWSPAR